MSELKEILQTTASYTTELEKNWIKNLKDLFLNFPRTYNVFNNSNDFNDLKSDQLNNFFAKVVKKNTQQTRSFKSIYKVIITDDNWVLAECVWFAKPFFWEMMKVWKKYYFVWKAKENFWIIQISAPKMEFDNSDFWWEDISPVYRQFWAKISSDWLRQKIYFNLKLIKDLFLENLPETILIEEKLIWKTEAIKILHNPKNSEELARAKERIAFEELFFLQKDALLRKEEVKSMWNLKNIAIKMDIDFVKKFFESLEFTPTQAQKIAIFQILKDTERKYPMNRLLEWDVWSWKTLVALTLAMNTVLSWKEVAIMSPTEVLTRQHFYSMTKMIENFEEKNPEYKWKFKTWLLLWAFTPKQKQEVLLKLLNWEINILIWTHSLITETVQFPDLWLAIIDEQHRFWVEQREKIKKWKQIHILNITATPIPRTLALVAYWDQDISVLNEMPKWRKIIKTSVIQQEWRSRTYSFIKKQVEEWRQVFVICPLIQENEKLELKSVVEETEKLKQIFPDYRITSMHWKLKSKEKDEIMQNFKNKEAEIMVSTSVIEVWVDVPNATIMLIEWAERFWLSQLHQFRWRVWRWEHQSYCFLFTSSEKDPSEIARLNAMQAHSDWFALAEIDMKLRWPWEVYWIRQSWVPDLKMASFSDHKMVLRARAAAQKFLWLDEKIL
jgi:ATP-dependent DNA helicase RecG